MGDEEGQPVEQAKIDTWKNIIETALIIKNGGTKPKIVQPLREELAIGAPVLLTSKSYSLGHIHGTISKIIPLEDGTYRFDVDCAKYLTNKTNHKGERIFKKKFVWSNKPLKKLRVIQ